MKHFLNSLEYPGKDYEVACAPDPLIVSTAQHVLHDALHLLGKSLSSGVMLSPASIRASSSTRSAPSSDRTVESVVSSSTFFSTRQ